MTISTRIALICGSFFICCSGPIFLSGCSGHQSQTPGDSKYSATKVTKEEVLQEFETNSLAYTDFICSPKEIYGACHHISYKKCISAVYPAISVCISSLREKSSEIHTAEDLKLLRFDYSQCVWKHLDASLHPESLQLTQECKDAIARNQKNFLSLVSSHQLPTLFIQDSAAMQDEFFSFLKQAKLLVNEYRHAHDTMNWDDYSAFLEKNAENWQKLQTELLSHKYSLKLASRLQNQMKAFAAKFHDAVTTELAARKLHPEILRPAWDPGYQKVIEEFGDFLKNYLPPKK